MEGYNVTIAKTSKELTHKERVRMKDTTNALSLDELTQDSPVLIDPDYYAVLDVHNEKSESIDYTVCILVDKAGTKYRTGSPSFLTSLDEIMVDMADCDEPWQLEVSRRPSKNHKGKEFLTCSVV